jgi:hypothetical protein
MRLKDQLYQKCSEFTVDRFISVVVDNDFSVLVKTKGAIKAKKKHLIEAWDKIYSEYSELLQNDEQKVYLVLIKERCALQSKIYVTQLLVESISKRYNEESLKVLKRLGFEFPFTKKSYIKDLNKVLTLIKSDQLQLVSVETQLKPFMKDVKINRSDILDLLILLSKHNGYAIKEEDTTLQSYISHLNAFKRWQAAQKLTK